MARTDKHAYDHHRAYNGVSLKEGEVLAPFWIPDEMKNADDTIIKENLTTWTFGGISFLIGFIPIAEESFDGYMSLFWKDIDSFTAQYRAGRCIIGYRSDGSPKTCPKANSCAECDHRQLLPRYNRATDSMIMLPESSTADGDMDDMGDGLQMDLSEAAALESTLLDLLQHLAEIKPRYAQIASLGLIGYSAQEIIDQLGLKTSWGYSEYNRARTLTRQYLDHTDDE